MVEIIGGRTSEPVPPPAPGGKPKLIVEGFDREEKTAPKPASAPTPEAAPKSPSTPKVAVDEDWKEQARREAEELDKKLSSEPRAGEELPKADFVNFFGGLVEQCLMELGAIPHPMIGSRVVNPPMAKYTIEVIEMLQAKTKGNLTAEETKLVETSLHALRVQFMNVTQQLLAAAERGELKTIGYPDENSIGAVPPASKKSGPESRRRK